MVRVRSDDGVEISIFPSSAGLGPRLIDATDAVTLARNGAPAFPSKAYRGIVQYSRRQVCFFEAPRSLVHGLLLWRVLVAFADEDLTNDSVGKYPRKSLTRIILILMHKKTRTR